MGGQRGAMLKTKTATFWEGVKRGPRPLQKKTFFWKGERGGPTRPPTKKRPYLGIWEGGPGASYKKDFFEGWEVGPTVYYKPWK